MYMKKYNLPKVSFNQDTMVLIATFIKKKVSQNHETFFS